MKIGKLPEDSSYTVLLLVVSVYLQMQAIEFDAPVYRLVVQSFAMQVGLPLIHRRLTASSCVVD
jgi:hypothetical protein